MYLILRTEKYLPEMEMIALFICVLLLRPNGPGCYCYPANDETSYAL